MAAIHIRRKLESDTPYLPEIKSLIGKTVEIIVQEAPDPTREDRWQALREIAGQDLIDPDVYKEQRAIETARMQAANDDSR